MLALWLFTALEGQAMQVFSEDSAVDASGGDVAAAGPYAVTDTAGQPAVGWASSASYALDDGFWNTVFTSPVLAELADRTVEEGALLAFTATVIDGEGPLNYSLKSGAPGGASINPSTGEFTWTPTEAQGPGAWAITVKVTDNGTPSLSATIRDVTAAPGDPAYDVNASDIRLATVTFMNRANNSVIVANLPVGLVTPADFKTGTATFDWNVNIGAADSQSFTIGTVVNGHYTRDAAPDNVLVTVSKPLVGEAVTGGGHLILSRSAGECPGDAGSKANFGFNVKHNQPGARLQGNIHVIVRNAGRVCQIAGTVMTSLSIGGKRGTFNGRVSLEDVTDLRTPIVIDGDATGQVKMTDNGEPGAADTLAITVWNRSGGLWFASHWDGKKTTEQTLAGGNLVVRSGRKTKAAPAGANAAAEPGPVRLAVTLPPGWPTDVSGAGAAPPRRFQIQFPAVPETDYALERSTDLVTWTHLTTVMSLTGELVFFVEAASPEGCQFYRVRELETSP